MSNNNTPRPLATALWTGPSCRVLVLDDDDLIVRSVSRTLRSHGLVVEATTDPATALAAAQREAPDVVVSDLHMPRSCGAEFLTSIAAIVPDAMRVLMSADPDFRPRLGSLVEARVHTIVAKSELSTLAGLIAAQLRGRLATAATPEEREALAKRVAQGLARPAHEDDEHRYRTARWSASVATAMNLGPEEIEAARLGAILHDIGQCTLPPHAFSRAGSLAPGDRAVITEHPKAGSRIIDAMPALRGALGVIESHHERQDGTGYPDGLAGAEIPAAARVFQVVDAYDAMTRGRPYAKPRSHRAAIAELERLAGSQHDPHAVGALASLGEEGLVAALL